MSTPREVFERYQQCVLDKDWRGFGELFSDTGVIELPFPPPCAPARHEGREAIRSAAREAWGRVPLAFEAFRSVVIHDGRDPDLLVAEYELCGTTVPGGEPFRLPFAAVLRVRDGRIASLREYLPRIEIAQLTAPRPPATPRAVWEAAIARYQAADIEGYVAMFAPDGVVELPFSLPGVPARMAGRDEILRTLGPLWRAARDGGRRVLRFDVTAVHTTTDASAAIVEFDAVGQHAGGETYQLSYVHVVHVRDGRIALLRDYVDTRRIAERLAAMAAARA